MLRDIITRKRLESIITSMTVCAIQWDEPDVLIEEIKWKYTRYGVSMFVPGMNQRIAEEILANTMSATLNSLPPPLTRTFRMCFTEVHLYPVVTFYIASL